MKFKVSQECDYVMEHLRYEHERQGIRSKD